MFVGSDFYQLSLIETGRSSASFEQIVRVPADDREDLHTWTVRMLTAHRCRLGLYVAEVGTVEAGEDQVDTDLWLAWDGASSFATTE